MKLKQVSLHNQDVSEFLDNQGVIYAFSDKQFEENRVEGVKYVSMDGGVLIPKKNLDKVLGGIKDIRLANIKLNKEEFSKEDIIWTEACNHEGCIDSTIDSLVGYGYSDEEIQKLCDTYYYRAVIS